ncbi:putative ribonuclease H-like domain-containing protein, partial [Tanacetum coccineum]
NTIDHLGKFDGKADEGFFVGYSINSKAFRVFNSRTRIVEENLHVQFSENTPNIAGSGQNWLFDIDALTKSMNYKPVIIGNQSNGNAGTKTCDDAGKARMETVPRKDYILLPLWPADLPFSQNSKSSPDVGFKLLGDNENKVTEEPGKESNDQEKDDNVNSTNNVNVASINKVNVVGRKSSIKLLDDPNMPELEDIVYSDDDEDVGTEDDMNNLDAFMHVSRIQTTRIHKDHPVEQIIGDLNSAPQTRRMTKNLEEHGLFSSVQQRTNHKDFQNCLFACFLSQEEPKKIYQIAKRPIGTKWVYRNKKDERGIVTKNKARLVAQGYTQEEGIDYDEVFAPVSRIEAIRLFLAYASFKDFVVYQMDVNSAFLYGKIEDEVYVYQPSGFEDPNFPDRVYKVEKALYGLHQAPRADSNEKKLIQMIKIHTNKNVAEFRTKALSPSRFQYLRPILECSNLKVSLLIMKMATVKVKMVNGEQQLSALVGGKKIIITEATVRRELQQEDADGVDCLPNAIIFEQLTLMSYSAAFLFLRQMPPRRNRVNNEADPAFIAAVAQAVADLLPTLIARITDEIRQNENNRNNVNRRNARRVNTGGSGNDGDAQPTDIHVWLERRESVQARLVTYKLRVIPQLVEGAYKQAKGRGLIKELMIEGIVTDMETVADMATETGIEVTERRISRFVANGYGRSYGSSSQSGYSDYASSPPCNICGKLNRERRVTGATGACLK